MQQRDRCHIANHLSYRQQGIDYFYLLYDIFMLADPAEPPMSTKREIAGVPEGVPGNFIRKNIL